MALIKLTNYDTKEHVLIGTEQIIEVKKKILSKNGERYEVTEIRSVGAMVTTNYVTETVDKIFKLSNNVYEYDIVELERG